MPTEIDRPALVDLQDHGQFLHVLETLGCSLALSRRPSGVALLGVTDGKPTLAACLLPRTMGLAVGGNRLAIATTRDVTIFANEPTLAPLYPDRPDHYDAIFVPRVSFHTAYCDLHDMVFDKNIVLTVNTRFNCISVIDGFFNFTPIWQPPFLDGLTSQDCCHLNGMAFADGKVSYVTMLGRSTEPGGWRAGMADGGLLMEVATGRVVCEGLSMPHSPRVIDGKLYVLEGGKGLLLEVDPASGATCTVATLPGFTHGLAAYKGILFVGLSKLRQKRGPQGLPIEDRAEGLMAGVAAVEPRSGRILGVLEFQTGTDEIFDLQLLPDVRRAEILAPELWARQPSFMTIKGGFWERKLGPSGNPEDDDVPPEDEAFSTTANSAPSADWASHPTPVKD
ncbi:TIGR03032 family protein [Sphingomonas sp. QA11]|uniref:TIGR03032 family protein n=1 Tax=Sphingomonas sp. QA11 TaxID=2950605 RepID=UPI002349CF88|nr:TIGR03032 family protein [Sphingomonas sp. QA11]WCM25946.1 TIGR03032 family protein [Sphingomonas sp. QA11]